MKLIDLAPKWFALPGRQGQGVSFTCPCCVGKERNRVRLAVAFANPLDGGEPVPLTPGVLWPVLWPEAGVPDVVTIPPGVHWARSGDTFDTLSCSPSVDASPARHWHGSITNGEAHP